MLNEKVAELMNDQINKEFYSSYLYLDMSNYYVDKNLDGFANWFRIQAQEERDHAILFMEYLQANSCKVTLEAVAKPDKRFEEPADPLKAALEHEQYVTSLINNIYDAAYQCKDFRSMQFLDWFVKEQMEEENNTDSLVQKFEMFGTDPKGLYMLDAELQTRVYAAPSMTVL